MDINVFGLETIKITDNSSIIDNDLILEELNNFSLNNSSFTFIKNKLAINQLTNNSFITDELLTKSITANNIVSNNINTDSFYITNNNNIITINNLSVKDYNINLNNINIDTISCINLLTITMNDLTLSNISTISLNITTVNVRSLNTITINTQILNTDNFASNNIDVKSITTSSNVIYNSEYATVASNKATIDGNAIIDNLIAESVTLPSIICDNVNSINIENDNLSANIIRCKLPEYITANDARNNITENSLFRTGSIVRISKNIVPVNAIELVGDGEITIDTSTDYIDQGYTLLDNTYQVEKKSNVMNRVEGIYRVKYNAIKNNTIFQNLERIINII